MITMNEVKQGLTKYWWIIGLALLLKFGSPGTLSSINVSTMSFFGNLGGGISTSIFTAGALLVVGGLIISTIGVQPLIGIPMIVAGFIMGGGTILVLVRDLFETTSFPIVAIGLIVLAFVFLFGKRRR